MNDSPSTQSKPSGRRQWPDYASVWRWHFYAGVFCIPFVIVLSISGTIYLYRPQIEAWQERHYDQLPVDGRSPISLMRQVESAVASVDGGRFVLAERPHAFDDSDPTTSATRVIVDRGGDRLRIFVHPIDGSVLGTVEEDQRFVRVVRRIHGELLLGKRGSYLVELAASWTIVMVLTGLVLWLPRKFQLAGVVYPRWNAKGKSFWKDIHSVGGLWASGLIVFLVATGLPWSLFWGDYFKSIRKVTGTTHASSHWDNGSPKGEHANHEEKRPARSGSPPWRSPIPDPSTFHLSQIDRVAPFAQSLNWLPPITLAPPSNGGSIWTIKSETANRPHQQTLRYDAESQEPVGVETFADRHWVDRVVGQGIALHEGQRFGLANQLIASAVTGMLLILSVTGIVLWWRRRDSFGLSPPASISRHGRITDRISRGRCIGLGLAVIGLTIYLPLFGLSLVVVLLLDGLVFTRFTPLAIWLGRRCAAVGP
ncbi:PepSY-associated TM helix [Rubripirellula tenax]|uniref:PepSY-associated TM helix n=1 Tax=Rubripirellula tenax TaxID=2528015 RepID=A0A5C6EGB9_9BACT|nr:PepSY domain-containing protein [Rubripirellula tenax]TWU46279.1 PepSY-associated TM helix [Rubripirellula tenax]